MELPTYFDDFLQNTSPTPSQKKIMTDEHKLLRERLMNDAALKPVLLATFIQGSQRRFTANRGDGQHPCDVDVVAVTNLPRSSFTAAYAHQLFQPFLERHYKGRYEPQDRSWCITVHEEVTIDLVPTSEPDSIALREAVKMQALREWDAELGSAIGREPGVRSLKEAVLAASRRDRDFDKSEPLWIPDRTLQVWEKTHPLFLIGWTARKNESTDGHFIHVVRAVKWWRREIAPLPKYPKGYPLEHLVGECCGDAIESVASGLSGCLEEMADRFAPYARRRETPFLAARGVHDPLVDVMRRVSGDDFAGFHEKLVVASALAQRALQAATIDESCNLWRQLLGPDFPEPPSKSSAVLGGFTQPAAPARPREGRFA